MTPKEAIKRIENHNEIHSRNEKHFAVHITEALNMAVEALQKRIPEKVNLQGDGYADGELVYDYAECPACGCDFEEETNGWGCKFCPDCGQALDWGEIDV